MKAITLIELLIVTIIIIIIAGVAIPNFSKAKERAVGKEAIASLKLISSAEKIYRMESSPTSYYPASGSETGIGNINTNLRLLLTENNWDYSITGGASSFTATADRPGSGGYLDCVYTLTHNDADGEPNPNASCP